MLEITKTNTPTQFHAMELAKFSFKNWSGQVHRFPNRTTADVYRDNRFVISVDMPDNFDDWQLALMKVLVTM